MKIPNKVVTQVIAFGLKFEFLEKAIPFLSTDDFSLHLTRYQQHHHTARNEDPLWCTGLDKLQKRPDKHFETANAEMTPRYGSNIPPPETKNDSETNTRQKFLANSSTKLKTKLKNASINPYHKENRSLLHQDKKIFDEEGNVVQYRDICIGSGQRLKKTMIVTIRYTVSVAGTDANSGAKESTFVLGDNNSIVAAMHIGLIGMKVGGKRIILSTRISLWHKRSEG